MSQDTKLPPLLPLPKPYSVAAAHGLDDLHTGDALIAYAQDYARAAIAAQAPQPIQFGTAEEARKDRQHAEAYCRQAEFLLTSNEKTLHQKIADLQSQLKAHQAQAEPQPEREPLSQAASDVLAERQRQISAEGWTPAHDDEHHQGSLSHAAAMYAIYGNVSYYGPGNPPSDWPWHADWWKPAASHRRNLVKAGALILAEIERLDRAAMLAARSEPSPEACGNCGETVASGGCGGLFYSDGKSCELLAARAEKGGT